MNPQTDLPLFEPDPAWYWLLLPIALLNRAQNFVQGSEDFDVEGAPDAEPEPAAGDGGEGEK